MKRTKLGMTIQPRKPTPYDKLAEKMERGAKEQGKLERRGTPFQERMQGRIPKVRPGGRGRGNKA